MPSKHLPLESLSQPFQAEVVIFLLTWKDFRHIHNGGGGSAYYVVDCGASCLPLLQDAELLEGKISDLFISVFQRRRKKPSK